MPSADPVMVSLATFAAECPFEELPSVTVEATKAATIAAAACLVRSELDRMLEASLEGARRALGISGGAGADSVQPLTLSAFEVGCRVASAEGSPVGPGATPLGVLSLAALVDSPPQPALAGREYLTSVAVGAEVQARLARVVHDQLGVRPRWLPGVLFSYLGVATAASRARALDKDQVASALGIAVTLASGSRQHLLAPAPLLGLAGGFAALGGTWAALQAASGVDGHYGALVGDWGLLPLWFEVSDAEAAISGLGRDFLFTEVGLRPSLAEQLASYSAALRALASEGLSASSTLSLRLLPESWAGWQSLAPERRAEVEGDWERSFHSGADTSRTATPGDPARLEIELVTDPLRCGVAARRGDEVVAFHPVTPGEARPPGAVFAAAEELRDLARHGRASLRAVDQLCALVERLEELDDVGPLRDALWALAGK